MKTFLQPGDVAALLSQHLRKFLLRHTDGHVFAFAAHFGKLLLRPVAQDAAADQFAQRRVIGPGQRRASGELVRRVQAEADHRDSRRFKQRQKQGADADRVFHGMFPVIAAAPTEFQFGPTDDYRGINPHRVGLQGNQLPGGVHRAAIIIPRKSGHHLQHQREAGLMDHF